MTTSSVKIRSMGGALLAVVGAGLIVLGLFVLARFAWLGGAEIVIGILALLALSARPKSAGYAGAVLGTAVLLLWLVAAMQGFVGWRSWLTLAFGIGLTAGGASASRAASAEDPSSRISFRKRPLP